jgi:hypothetical protein
MFGQSLWNPARRPDMSGLIWGFGGRIDFDVLYFTNSPNVSPLIDGAPRTQIRYKILNSMNLRDFFLFHH